MKTYILSATVILALALGSLAAEKRSSPTEPPLVPSELIWVFGIIPPSAKVTHHYALSNPHEDTVTITEIESDCDCTTVPKAPVAIAPGETYLLKVEFDTRTYYGETNREIKITTDYEPLPKMILYFTSVASQMPRTLRLEPPMTAFIPGKDSQTFVIRNLSDQITSFTVLLDHDSVLTTSDSEFDLKGKQAREITISPVWEHVAPGYTHSCVVLEFRRDKVYYVSIPIKINKF